VETLEHHPRIKVDLVVVLPVVIWEVLLLVLRLNSAWEPVVPPKDRAADELSKLVALGERNTLLLCRHNVLRKRLH
jgi:hypothetical protein